MIIGILQILLDNFYKLMYSRSHTHTHTHKKKKKKKPKTAIRKLTVIWRLMFFFYKSN